MGEEKKDSEKKEEVKKEEEQPPAEIVLKVDMHCEACARKVARALKGFEGVEEVSTDCKASKVVVKGKSADPLKVCERLQKKSGKKVEIISPLPKPPEETPKEEKKEEKPQDKKDEPPPVVTVVLKVRMHCDACAHVLQKRIRKMKGVESVETDLANGQVVVKGVIDPAKLEDYVKKRTGKHVSIVKEEEKKEETKKAEEDKKSDDAVKDNGDKKEGEAGADDTNNVDIKNSEYWPSKYYMEYAHSYPPPQMFSDENPHACCLM
ncbi:heavy metal-associated isoprenylated plant protein 7-like [Rutidosis leptorrhynchoides]|uniref:heavy metal-associated isoprenylated plant protein 7-like n=1 Tax=Rutidosis leptorrhynchoides TaxID=125765 RepID=UPI003A99F69B